MPATRLRFSHETQRTSRSLPSSNARLFSAVIQLTGPSNRLNNGVVRTTSPVAPSLMINTLIFNDVIVITPHSFAAHQSEDMVGVILLAGQPAVALKLIHHFVPGF